MSKAKKTFYRYCLVPGCKNTIISTPEKVFFSVTNDPEMRKQWCEVMGRGEVSPISHLHCCQDHFNIEEDTTNYIQYNIMKQQGVKVMLRLKEGVVPHRFHCQKRNKPSRRERMYAIKRQRLSRAAVKSTNASEVEEIGAGQSTFHVEGSDDCRATPSTSRTDETEQTEASSVTDKSHCDKALQVNIKAKYRSKGVQVNKVSEMNSQLQDGLANRLLCVRDAEVVVFVRLLLQQLGTLRKSVGCRLMGEVEVLVADKTGAGLGGVPVKNEIELGEFCVQVKQEVCD